MNLRNTFLGMAFMALFPISINAQTSEFCDISSSENIPMPVFPVPTEVQLRWHDMEFYAFVHFGINTFTNKEWGYGNEGINQFNPTQAINTDQWVEEFANLGMKGVIYTAKHHDGFCTWFTESTNHSTKNNTTSHGHVNVPKMISESCTKYGLKFGAYISPWDRNNAEYAREGYVETFHQQISELCSGEYGEIFEMWFDGANGGDGYYGGANESRGIGNDYYDMPKITKIIRELQPNCAIWGGEDCVWIGNEEGWAGTTSWSPFSGNTKLEYGDENGWRWYPGEVDAKNGNGWFWNTAADNSVASGARLFQIYMQSIGRNANLVLNFPPNKAGRLSDATVAKMREFKTLLTNAFGTDHAQATGVTATATSIRNSSAADKFSPANVLDGNSETYWATEDGTTSASIDIDLGTAKTVKYIRMGEHIRLGQRVKSFKISTWNGTTWVDQSATEEMTTIGHKRIITLTSPVSTQKVRLTILDSKVCPLINRISIY